jgi:hypothetical protein
VRIDRLVLDGLALGPGDAGRVRRAVEAELGRLLAEGGVSPALASGPALPAVDAGGFVVDRRGPSTLGRQIARALYRGIGT